MTVENNILVQSNPNFCSAQHRKKNNKNWVICTFCFKIILKISENKKTGFHFRRESILLAV